MTDLRTYHTANGSIRRKSIGIVLSKIDEKRWWWSPADNLCKQFGSRSGLTKRQTIAKLSLMPYDIAPNQF